MMRVRERAAVPLVMDLAEDLATRWVPDVVADADVAAAVNAARLANEDVRFIDVPRVDGGFRRAPVLSASALAAVRKAVEPIRAVSEAILDPAVCGYRAGADGSSAYSEEYRRFRSFAEALSETSSFVVIADVQNFFESIGPVSLRRSFDERLGGDWTSLNELMVCLRKLGVVGLPAGYGDARLIANMVLSAVEEGLPIPFTRWVDDYRIFASSLTEAESAVAELRSGLRRVGLRLNEKKLCIIESNDYRRRRHGAPLDSVYHPQDEPDATVRANLRTVFLRAVMESDRRQLRFALPRLADQGDPVAMSYALTALAGNSVDAPRLVHYVSHFLAFDGQASKVEAIARHDGLSDWTFTRLAPLLIRFPLSDPTIDKLRRRFEETESSLLQGLLLRVLSVQGQPEPLAKTLDGIVIPDARAAIAACRDLDSPVTARLREAAPATAEALDLLETVPLPKVSSLL